MIDPIFLLSPPRSFSSVVSSIIGQHPDLYCFPELHLLYRDDIGHLLSNKSNIKYARFAPSGLLRAIAQVHENKQDSAACSRAWMWLANNQSMTSKQLFEYLCNAYYPRVCIEKSPPNTKTIDRMIRLFKYYPNAKFIHLTRSVVGASKSLKEFFEFRRTVNSPAAGHPMVKENYALMWYAMHRNILKFRSIVPPSNFLTVSGEAILSDPRVVLPQLCRWLGVSDDSLCIDEMLKPEASPYAFYGPRMAPCGNDPKFITNPEFRQMRRKKYSQYDVREYLLSNGRPAFTRSYLDKLDDEATIERLHSWDYSMLELVMDMEAQLGYA
ncbi:sulfotransferase [Synechococcus sp. CBW1002]|uniref:sulfotransferase family protein n=1 Tax=Synechococcus sp. CBW1002 TaxID=1353134 RepID=UPI0018CE3227|nr:sulfotransferase [Synechococcus sp. CBW1002]QPN59289.1 sulfotransferase [Synechococcus sp. CBW1002]